MTIIRFYRYPGSSEHKRKEILKTLQQKFNGRGIQSLETELCYHIELEGDSNLSPKEADTLKWLLRSPLDTEKLTLQTSLEANSSNDFITEVGPRNNFSTAYSSNAVSICQNIDLKKVKRFELSRRFLIRLENCKNNAELQEEISQTLYDRMTQCIYTDKNLPVKSFEEGLPDKNESWYHVPVMQSGRQALEDVNKALGLAFDDWDLSFYTELFKNKLKRNPTSVECFDLAQSNSEHSRHWFFKGKMIVNAVEEDESLIDMIISTQKHSNQNNTIAFSDNSSAIKGFTHKVIQPKTPGKISQMIEKTTTSDLIFTAETHNMPTAVAPFSGATTGTGGRIRDVQGVGRGGHTIAGTAGYSVGNLLIPGYDLPWEDQTLPYPSNFANPLQILIEASNGASDYGNKFGEPIISGFVNSYGAFHDNERIEYIKPIMFTGGLGFMDSSMTEKNDPHQGMLLVKIGGPVYRIGVGGGAASSVEVQGDNDAELDFGAVQRGDAEMEQKLNRVVRACIELGSKNPIQAIHDQGAGGNGNVLKELVEPKQAGAVIFVKDFKLGDPTLNVLEIWGAEYQENNALLCKPEDRQLLTDICNRERCPINFVGVVTGNGYVTLTEDTMSNVEKYLDRKNKEEWGNVPFDLHLDAVLGKMPRKEFKLNRRQSPPLNNCQLNDHISIDNALTNVLKLLSVGSKRFLTNKVDRCVTGLIAQQQCVGPLHTPVADYAIAAITHSGFEGVASSIGSQPIKGISNPAAGARMSVAEALSNIVFAKISQLADIKCSGNWMWAAKLPEEGAKLFDACKAMCEFMSALTIAIDGGKDSLSMAARVGTETVKSPGTLVISCYAPCPDIRIHVTPDLKGPSMNEKSVLLWVDISNGLSRIGGSALAQCFNLKNFTTPDVEKPSVLKAAFNTTQELLKENFILSGHDISDGGLVTCLVEMAIAGLSGINVNILTSNEHMNSVQVLFSEEVGWVLEVLPSNVDYCLNSFTKAGVKCSNIGTTNGLGIKSLVQVSVNKTNCINESLLLLMRNWELTSYNLELKQMNKDCADDEFNLLANRNVPQYNLTFNPDCEVLFKSVVSPIRVAVIREEGSNGDREMIASLMDTPFEIHDVTMQDLLGGVTSLDQYRGVVFPGGFSYADTLGSAKGWAASILFNDNLRQQFNQFIKRSNTFSLGVCNGCQLMSQIGWIGKQIQLTDVPDIALEDNTSERFECRWSTIKINSSNSIMLRGMEGSVFGVWVAHGEGRFTFRDEAVYKKMQQDNCFALHFVNDAGEPTEIYPMNPNGSIGGLAGVCSADGRHLAMMPHPERCTRMWQWPWMPPTWNKYEISPWQKIFTNAYNWCTEN